MSGHITPPQFDPHAEAIEGAPVDPWPRDFRVTDERVRVTPKRTFLLGDDEWGGDKGILDVLDARPAVDDSHNPPARPVRADSLPVQPVTQPLRASRSISEVTDVMVFGIVCFVLGGLAVYAMLMMAAAR